MTRSYKTCSQPGCTRTVHCTPRNGPGPLCNPHAARWYRGKPLDPPVRSFDPDRGCATPDCPKPHLAYGYCRNCYERVFGVNVGRRQRRALKAQENARG